MRGRGFRSVACEGSEFASAADLLRDLIARVRDVAERKPAHTVSRTAQVALLATLGLGPKQIACVTETSISNINRCLAILRDRAGWSSPHDGLRWYVTISGADIPALLAEFFDDANALARILAVLSLPPAGGPCDPV